MVTIKLSTILIISLASVSLCTATEEREKAIWHAAEHGKISVIQQALKHNESLTNKRITFSLSLKNSLDTYETVFMSFAPEITCFYRLLDVAATRGHVKTAKLLITNGAHVMPQDEPFLIQPLHIAAAHGHIRVSKLLLEKGASINAKAYNYTLKNSKGFTPLYCALINKHTKYALWLLRHGANPFCGENPEHECTRRQMEELIESKIWSRAQKNLELLREWRKAPLTLCCGLHPRCGANSPFRLLSQSFVQEIINYLWPEVIKKSPLQKK